jgi:hypothetical protein
MRIFARKIFAKIEDNGTDLNFRTHIPRTRAAREAAPTLDPQAIPSRKST